MKQKFITDEIYRDLFPSGSTPGILYGLPKVHKENCPARPILSAIATYNYKLAKFLVPLLQPLTVGQYTVKDSFSFVSEITAFQNDSDLVMASFDVSSLFTNIPLDESVDLCVDLLFAECDTFEYKDCKFNRTQSRKLLNFAVKDTHLFLMGSCSIKLMGQPWDHRYGHLWLTFLCVCWNNDILMNVLPNLSLYYIAGMLTTRSFYLEADLTLKSF